MIVAITSVKKLAVIGVVVLIASFGDVTMAATEEEASTNKKDGGTRRTQGYYYPVPSPTYHYYKATPYPTHRPPTPWPTGKAPTPKPSPYPTPPPTNRPTPYLTQPKAYVKDPYYQDPYHADSYYKYGSPYPTPRPTSNPTRSPTMNPTSNPTPQVTTPQPTFAPTPEPSFRPTPDPTPQPTFAPSFAPTKAPSSAPSPAPSSDPTSAPTAEPSSAPSPAPSSDPTSAPTAGPSEGPTNSEAPSNTPTENPTKSEEPSENPTMSEEPSNNPTQSEEPSNNPTQSEEPSDNPTQSEEPSEFPTQSEEPSFSPTITENPTDPDFFVTLLGIICFPANADQLGFFCDAIIRTGLAPVLNNGVRRELKEGEQEQERERELKTIGTAGTAISISNRVKPIAVIDDVQYTVFGFTNAAFNALPKATRDFLFSDKGNDALRDIVKYHLVEDRRIDYRDLVCDRSYLMTNDEYTQTKCGSDKFTKFQVGEGNTIRPQISLRNIPARNGVLHVVNEVILPLKYFYLNPSKAPTESPEEKSTPSPTKGPGRRPSEAPTKSPSEAPTMSPTFNQCCPMQADDAQTCVDSMEFVYTNSKCSEGAPDDDGNNAVPGYCVDDTSITVNPPVTIQLFLCGNNLRGTPLYEISSVTDGERIFINSVNLGAVQCLPKCVQVKIEQADGTIAQTFNINTSCANNDGCGYSVPSNGLCPADCPFYAGFPGSGAGATCGVPGIAAGCPASVLDSLCAAWDGFGGLGLPGFNTGSLQFVDYQCPTQGFLGLTPGCGRSPLEGVPVPGCPDVCPQENQAVSICSF